MTPVTIPRPVVGGPNESLAAVATMLDPAERARVDAAGIGVYRALHRDSLDDVFRDLRERQIGAVLVSVCRCADRDAAKIARLVREFPRVPAVALLTQLEQQTPRAVLALGRSGIRAIVKVWAKLLSRSGSASGTVQLSTREAPWRCRASVHVGA